MRITVLLTDGFGGHGGIAKFNRDMLTALCSIPGCEEVTALPRLMPDPPGPLPSKLVYSAAGLRGKSRYLAAVLRQVLFGRKPDLVLCAHIHLLPLAWLCRMLSRARLILVVHGVDAWQPTRSRLANRLACRVDRFIAVSDFTRRRFSAWSGAPLEHGVVIPNCIQQENFGPGPKDPALLRRYGLEGRTVLMTLARLSADERYKGIDEILEALPSLSESIPDLSYFIAGDGTDRGRLEAKAISLGLGSRVVFAGRITESEKAAHYRLADAFAMPGFGEGFGIVYLEAMACGVPVVASKADASREALRDGKLGIVVDPRNRGELQAGILEALRRPRGVVPEGLDYFSFENFQRRLHAAVNSVVAG